MTKETLISICRPVEQSGRIPENPGRLRQDSRLVNGGETFIAMKGLTTDGHLWLNQAAERGASLLIGEVPRPADLGEVAYLQVESTRKILGPLAQAFEGNPAEGLQTVGITGTNGKTTVATLVWQALEQSGVKTGLLGTAGKRIGQQHIDSRLTTADPIEIASDMRKMLDAECRVVAMEVSSHALEQHRTDGIEWKVGAFTNLSHDHLDYHDTMDRYTAAKKRLFDNLGKDSRAVINADDPAAKEMIRNCKADIIDFAFQSKASRSCRLIKTGADGIEITVDGQFVRSPLAGQFNASNVAQALLICDALGYDRKEVAKSLETCPGAPGRLEAVTLPGEHNQKPVVFVDYAHTPDALDNVSSTLSELKGRDRELVLLFGCGGDRDRDKRPQMARIAEKWADRLMITSDNPRTEEPEAIIRDIEQGLSSSGKKKSTSIVSRKEAIEQAIRSASPRSLILIAGKGHETYQEIQGERYPFDDRVIARQALDHYPANRNAKPGKEVS